MIGAAPRSATGRAVALDLGGDDLACRHRLLSPVAQGLGHRGTQRVHVEQRDAPQGADLWVDVAWYAEVDHQERRVHRHEVGRSQHVRLGGDGAEDDVGLGQLGRDVVERDGSHGAGARGHLANEVLGSRQRAVDHDDRARGVGLGDLRQGAAHTETHVACAHDDDARAAQPGAVLAPGDRHGGVGERRRALGDGGLGAHPLAGLQRVAEERGKHGPARALLLAALEGATHLSHHLGLAGHDGLEARRHREQVGGDVVVEANGGVGGQLLLRGAGLLGQHVIDFGDRVVEAVDHRVDLGAQAGRQHHRLLDVATVAQGAEHFVQVGIANGRRLQQGQRGLCVLEPYNDDGQPVPSRVGAQLCRSRPAGRQSRTT